MEVSLDITLKPTFPQTCPSSKSPWIKASTQWANNVRFTTQWFVFVSIICWRKWLSSVESNQRLKVNSCHVVWNHYVFSPELVQKINVLCHFCHCNSVVRHWFSFWSGLPLGSINFKQHLRMSRQFQNVLPYFLRTGFRTSLLLSCVAGISIMCSKFAHFVFLCTKLVFFFFLHILLCKFKRCFENCFQQTFNSCNSVRYYILLSNTKAIGRRELAWLFNILLHMNQSHPITALNSPYWVKKMQVLKK